MAPEVNPVGDTAAVLTVRDWDGMAEDPAMPRIG